MHEVRTSIAALTILLGGVWSTAASEAIDLRCRFLPDTNPPRVEFRLGPADEARQYHLEIVTPEGETLAEATLVQLAETDVARAELPELLVLDEALSETLPWSNIVIRSTDGGFHEVFGISAAATDFPLVSVIGTPLRNGIQWFGEITVRHRDSGLPWAGMPVRIRLADDDGTSATLMTAETGEDGAAGYDVVLPSRIEDGSTEFIAEALHGVLILRGRFEIGTWDARRLSIATDRQLYRPTETVLLRLVSVVPGIEILPSLPMAVTIEDPTGQIVFEDDMTTSDRGVASTEWRIPDFAEPGGYEVTAISMDPQAGIEGWGWFQVRPYELPTLTATLIPGRPFHLRGQDATVDVCVTTLAGTPISGARIELSERWSGNWWDWADETEDLDEDELAAFGTSAADGCTTLAVDLQEIHEDIADGWRRFEDVEFIARISDPSSHRVVHRPLDLRVTRDPIHLSTRWEGVNARGLPLRQTVTTSRADGQPVPCSVRVIELDEDENPMGTPTTTTTDTLGIGVFETPQAVEDDLIEYRLEADCGPEGRGSRDFDDWLRDSPAVRLIPRSIFHVPGQDITVDVETTLDHAELDLWVRTRTENIEAIPFTVSDGSATVVVPYRSEFRGPILLAVPLGVDAAAEHEFGAGARAFALYPGDSAFTTTIEAPSTDARPGDQLELNLRSADEKGHPVASVAGVVAVDTALEVLLEEQGDREAKASFATTSSETMRFYRYDEVVAGVSAATVLAFDPTDPPHHLEGVARALFPPSDDSWWAETTDIASELEERFSHPLGSTVKWIRSVLRPCPLNLVKCPQSQAAVEEQLRAAGFGDDAGLDPWGNTPHIDTRPGGSSWQTLITSPGPDRELGTTDDIGMGTLMWPWFPLGDAILSAVRDDHALNGRWSSESETVRAVVGNAGVDLEGFRDPWGDPVILEAEADGARIKLWVESPNISAPAWSGRVNTFDRVRERMERLFVQRALDGLDPPTDGAEVAHILKEGGFSDSDLSDLHGTTYRFTVRFDTKWGDETVVRNGLMVSNPLRKRVYRILVHSNGPDREPRTIDDVFVESIGHELMHLVSTITDIQFEALQFRGLTDPEATAVLVVLVTDSEGGGLPGVTVTATLDATDALSKVVTDASGRAVLALSPGTYSITATLVGFETARSLGIPVTDGEVVSANLEMTMGQFGEVIEVRSEIPDVETTKTLSAQALAANETISPGKEPMATPRLRTDFPTTALWLPEVVLEGGTATIDFPLPDTVTTWRVQSVAHTHEGKVAMDDTLVVANLPVVAELNPPQSLTVGDRIHLPVVIRSTVDRDIEGTATLETESDGVTIGAADGTVTLSPRGVATATYQLEAVAPADDIDLTATFISPDVADAVQKTTRVVPHARRRTASTASWVGEGATIEVPDAGADASTWVTVVPTLDGQISAALDGLKRRPGSCSEQLTSAALVELCLAESLASKGEHGAAAVARNRVRSVLKRLESRQTPPGGMAYWNGGRSHPALTAHVLRLVARAETAGIERPKWTTAAIAWMIAQVDDNGLVINPWSRVTDVGDSALVALALAENAASYPEAHTTAARMVAILAPRVDLQAMPYGVAAIGMASQLIGLDDLAEESAQRLVASVRRENGAAFWQLERNTPLAGWGMPGRVETTALAVRMLAGSGHPEAAPLLDDAFRYLLRHKGFGGGWWTTPATAMAVEALLALSGPTGEVGSDLEIRSGGTVVARIPLRREGEPLRQRRVDLTGVDPELPLEVAQIGGDGLVEVAVHREWFEAWGPPATEAAVGNHRLEVRYSATETAPGQPVSVDVHAFRVASRGYGMLLAEIGLPPGAQVDRTSFEGISEWRTEIWPDRVILYLWPRARGEHVRFRFTPIFAGFMRTAPSRLADYYNPDASVSLPPVAFTISE